MKRVDWQALIQYRQNTVDIADAAAWAQVVPADPRRVLLWISLARKAAGNPLLNGSDLMLNPLQASGTTSLGLFLHFQNASFEQPLKYEWSWQEHGPIVSNQWLARLVGNGGNVATFWTLEGLLINDPCTESGPLPNPFQPPPPPERLPTMIGPNLRDTLSHLGISLEDDS